MATNTTATSQTHNGNGSTASFAISFSFLENTEVDVTVGGVLKTITTHYTISGSTVTFTSGNIPPSGTANIKFQRNTNISVKKVDFADGSVLTETDLDNNSDQILFAQQEITTKLNGIEEGATADQTDAEIRTAVEAATDSNVFTDADHTKLNGIEASATADQTDAEIRTAVENASDSNVFTDADHSKLNGIEAGATADQTITEIKSLIAGSPLDASHLAADSVGSSELAANSVTTSEIADAELKTLAGMQSGTASKLADSTALTSDIADLNQLDGLQKATTITDDDTKFPTSGAIVDYVAAQLAPIGGFEAIANESSFPNTQPASGVVISIADAGGMAVSSTGTASGQTVGGTTVNISGIATNFRGASVAAGIRFLVSSTGSGQNYTYHKATLKEDDLVSLSGDINDFSERYRVGSSNPTTSLDSGDLFFNTSTGKLLVYNGTNSAWEEAQSIGNFFISTLSPAFDGSTTDFTITNAPTNAQQILLIVEGVIQKPNSGTSTPTEGFALSGSTVKLAAAPAVGASYHAVVMGSTVNIGTPSDNTVTTSILQNNSVSTQKIQDESITLSKLEHGTSSNNGKFLRANNGADPTFETVNTDLVSDTSPQLGGTLDTNQQDIEFKGSDGNTKIIFDASQDQLELLDNVALSFGSHTSTGDYSISYVNGGDFTILAMNGGSDDFIIGAYALGVTTKHLVSLRSTGAIELYYGGVKKAETTATGILVSGNVVLTNALLPNADSANDIGQTSVRWRNIYADNYYGDGSGLTGLASDSIIKNLTLASGASTTNAKIVNINQSGEVEQLPTMSTVGTFVADTGYLHEEPNNGSHYNFPNQTVNYSGNLAETRRATAGIRYSKTGNNYRVRYSSAMVSNVATLTIVGELMNADGSYTASGTTQTITTSSDSNNIYTECSVQQWKDDYWIGVVRSIRNTTSVYQTGRFNYISIQMFTVNPSTGAISLLGSSDQENFNHLRGSNQMGSAFGETTSIFMKWNAITLRIGYQAFEGVKVSHYKPTTSGISQISSWTNNTNSSYSSSSYSAEQGGLNHVYATERCRSVSGGTDKSIALNTSAFEVYDFTGNNSTNALQSSTAYSSGTEGYLSEGFNIFINATHFLHSYKDINNKRRIKIFSTDGAGSFSLVSNFIYEDTALSNNLGAIVSAAVKSATEIAIYLDNGSGKTLSSIEINSSYVVQGVKDPITVNGLKGQIAHQAGNVFHVFNNNNLGAAVTAPYTVNSYKNSVPFIFGGVAQETKSSGTAKICFGGIASGFTGLTVGLKYYIDGALNGNITTDSVQGTIVGTAISPTELLIGDVRT